ncbi:hypothetical protein BSG1_16245 [Bacillus sp. SG-1]|nr:hypothetical protein BSG1_16245 [Bacillus sp. SG-1]
MKPLSFLVLLAVTIILKESGFFCLMIPFVLHIMVNQHPWAVPFSALK